MMVKVFVPFTYVYTSNVHK